MKIIIMCGGDYHTKIPRQLIQIHGEPIVVRTIRQLRGLGVLPADISISSNDERFKGLGVKVLTHENYFGNGGRWLDGFYPMQEPVIYLFGDVAFSPEALEKILMYESEDPVMFFASAAPFSKDYIKKWAEPFAFKVKDPKFFRECIQKTIRLSGYGSFKREPISWELWQVIKGTPLNRINYHNYVCIKDYTCDIDSEAEAKQFEKVVSV